MEKLETRNKRQDGFATLELLIAMVMIVLSITAVILLVFSNQSTSVGTQTNQEALYKAQEALENARATAKLDFNLVNPTGPTTDGIYQISLAVEQVDLWTKKITSDIDWSAEGGVSPTVQLTTLLTNPTAVSGGDTCSSVLEGDWNNPQISEPIDVGTTSSGNPVTNINVFDKKIYITTDNSHGQNNDFYIYDISSDPKNPSIVGPADGIDVNSKKRGLNAVTVSKNGSSKYAYVANAYDSNFSTCSEGPSCSQLVIIDVTDPISPTVVRSYKLPGITGNIGSGNNQAIGKSIFYKDGFVYLGLTKTASGPEFNIIDVTDPLNPVRVGSYPVGRGINAIHVRNGFSYIATDDNSKEIIVLNVIDPSAPALVGTYNATPDVPGFGYGKSLSIVGNRLYTGRTYISNAPEFLVLDNSIPGIIPSTPITTMDIGPSSDPQSLNGIIVRDYLGFFTTTDYFQVWNLSTMSQIRNFDLSDIVHSGSVGSSSDCEGNYIYIGSYRSSNDKGVILVVWAI